MSDVTAATGRILIVEDSPSQAAVIAEVVRQTGFVPVVYNDLPKPISQILQEERPRAVLLDLRLLDADGNPIGDGFQICREIKRSSNRVPVVVITAEEDEDAYEWATLQGADAFIQKPFAVGDLAEVISRVIREGS